MRSGGIHLYIDKFKITSHMCGEWPHEWATGGPMSGPLPISYGNNLISDLAYLFRMKPLPKSNFGLAFG